MARCNNSCSRPLISAKNKAANSIMTRKDDFVLCVEGNTDVQFLKRLIDTSILDIVPSSVIEENYEVGRDGVLTFLTKTKGKTNYYGLIDRDYDYMLKEIHKKYSNFYDNNHLIVTDGNCLETTLLQFDSQSVEKQLRNDFIQDNKNYIPAFNIVEKALELSFNIGTLRFLDKTHTKLNFSGNGKKHNFYNNLTCPSSSKTKLDRSKACEYDIEFNFEKFCDELLEESKNSTFTRTYLVKYAMDNHDYDIMNFNKWKRCQGHDVVGILTALQMKHKIGPKAYCNPKDVRKQLEQTDYYKNKMEALIINTVSLDKFKESEIYRKLCTISRVNDLDFLKC